MQTIVAVALQNGQWVVLTREEFAAARRRGDELMGGAVVAAASPGAPTTEKLLNSRELAAMCGVNDTLLEQMAKDGRIPSVRIGRLLRFEPAAVLAVLRGKECGA